MPVDEFVIRSAYNEFITSIIRSSRVRADSGAGACDLMWVVSVEVLYEDGTTNGNRPITSRQRLGPHPYPTVVTCKVELPSRILCPTSFTMQ
jgi:hypothetical protein